MCQLNLNVPISFLLFAKISFTFLMYLHIPFIMLLLSITSSTLKFKWYNSATKTRAYGLLLQGTTLKLFAMKAVNLNPACFLHLEHSLPYSRKIIWCQLIWHLVPKERKKDILMSFKRPKWPIRPNKRLHLKAFSCLRE